MRSQQWRTTTFEALAHGDFFLGRDQNRTQFFGIKINYVPPNPPPGASQAVSLALWVSGAARSERAVLPRLSIQYLGMECLSLGQAWHLVPDVDANAFSNDEIVVGVGLADAVHSRRLLHADNEFYLFLPHDPQLAMSIKLNRPLPTIFQLATKNLIDRDLNATYTAFKHMKVEVPSDLPSGLECLFSTRPAD